MKNDDTSFIADDTCAAKVLLPFLFLLFSLTVEINYCLHLLPLAVTKLVCSSRNN